jgi:hypothetical protein
MPPDADAFSTLTPAQVAQRFGCAVKKVLAWIDSGELLALDVSLAGRRGKKGRYRIRPADLADFERRRLNTPAPTTRRPRPAAANGVYFPHR